MATTSVTARADSLDRIECGVDRDEGQAPVQQQDLDERAGARGIHHSSDGPVPRSAHGRW